MRTLGLTDRSAHLVGARQRLAAGAALAVAATSVVVLGAAGTAFASSVSDVTAAATPATAGALAQYAVTFTAQSALSANNGTITIDLPSGTSTPASSGDYTVNGHLLVIDPTVTAQSITLTTPVDIAAASSVVIGAVHILNPVPGSYPVTVSTSSDTTAASSVPYLVTAASGSQVSNVTAAVAPTGSAASATYTVSFTAKNALAAGSGTITLTGPGGTGFPLAAAKYEVNGAQVTATPTGSAGSVTLTTPVGVGALGSVNVIATGVTNPGAGVQTLTVATSADATPSASTFYSILPGGGGGGGNGTPGSSSLVRLFGADRFGTAIAASQAEFATNGTAGAVVLARADDYPDALVGTPLAAAKHAPLLFASGGTLTAATQAEIQRVLPAGGTVYLLGGTAAIPATVATALTTLGYAPVRYSGADRYATALAVANALGNPGTVLLATGINFPDALAAGPAAAHLGGVVLLTSGTSLPAGVQTYLAAHPGKVYAVGGPAVAADKSASALSGADRYATATAVAAAIFAGGPVNVGVASGTTFPDALSGGAFEALADGPVLLSDPNALPSSTSTYLKGSVATIASTTLFGGTSALSAGVATSVAAALGLS